MSQTSDLDAWIAEQIDASIPDHDDWIPRELAEKLTAQLEEFEADELDEWMRLHAARFIKAEFLARHRRQRHQSLQALRRGVFSKAAESYEAGDETALDPYRIPYKIDEATGLTAHLGEMTGAQCARAAEPFERRIAENALQAKFLRALEKRLKPRQKVKSVYSRKQLADMFESLGLEVAL